MRSRHPYGSGTGTERITAFSDGVFAIAITLLVLDLKVPEVASHAAAERAAALLAVMPQIFTFLLSFLIIALYWIVHHRMFTYIRRYDPALVWLNILFLLGITFLPFPTSVLAEYGPEHATVVLYFGTLGAVGLIGTIMWWYATSGHRLVDADIDPGVVVYSALRGLSTVLIFALGIAISFVSPSIALYCPLLIPLAHWGLHRRYYREESEIETQEFGAQQQA